MKKGLHVIRLLWKSHYCPDQKPLDLSPYSSADGWGDYGESPLKSIYRALKYDMAVARYVEIEDFLLKARLNCIGYNNALQKTAPAPNGGC